MTEALERQIIELVAADRLYIPVSSIDNKLKKRRPVMAREIVLPDGKPYNGERVFARIENEDHDAARGMREGVDLFKEKYPKYGEILEGLIQEKRVERETHLYFGTQEGKRLSADDYLGVMANLGFSESSAKSLYKELIDTSRAISRKRDEERSVMINSTIVPQKTA